VVVALLDAAVRHEQHRRRAGAVDEIALDHRAGARVRQSVHHYAVAVDLEQPVAANERLAAAANAHAEARAAHAISHDRIGLGGPLDEDPHRARLPYVVARNEVAERSAEQPDRHGLSPEAVAEHAVVARAVDRDPDSAVVVDDVAEDAIAVRWCIAEVAVVEHDAVPAVVRDHVVAYDVVVAQAGEHDPVAPVSGRVVARDDEPVGIAVRVKSVEVVLHEAVPDPDDVARLVRVRAETVPFEARAVEPARRPRSAVDPDQRDARLPSLVEPEVLEAHVEGVEARHPSDRHAAAPVDQAPIRSAGGRLPGANEQLAHARAAKAEAPVTAGNRGEVAAPRYESKLAHLRRLDDECRPPDDEYRPVELPHAAANFPHAPRCGPTQVRKRRARADDEGRHSREPPHEHNGAWPGQSFRVLTGTVEPDGYRSASSIDADRESGRRQC
jgi:hypothetical protein